MGFSLALTLMMSQLRGAYLEVSIDFRHTINSALTQDGNSTEKTIYFVGESAEGNQDQLMSNIEQTIPGAHIVKLKVPLAEEQLIMAIENELAGPRKLERF